MLTLSTDSVHRVDQMNVAKKYCCMLHVESLTPNHHVQSTPTAAMLSSRCTPIVCMLNLVWSVYLSSGSPGFSDRNDFVRIFCIFVLRLFLATKARKRLDTLDRLDIFKEDQMSLALSTSKAEVEPKSCLVGRMYGSRQTRHFTAVHESPHLDCNGIRHLIKKQSTWRVFECYDLTVFASFLPT